MRGIAVKLVSLLTVGLIQGASIHCVCRSQMIRCPAKVVPCCCRPDAPGKGSTPAPRHVPCIHCDGTMAVAQPNPEIGVETHLVAVALPLHLLPANAALPIAPGAWVERIPPISADTLLKLHCA